MTAPLRILLVNDDEDGLFLLTHVVKQSFPTAETIGFRTAALALDYLRASPVDAIVTDSRMPGLSGIDLARLVRAFDRAIPIIMVTSAEEKSAEALAAGVTCFIAASDWHQIRDEIQRTVTAARKRS